MHIVTQRVEGRPIRLGPRANRDIVRGLSAQAGNELRARELSQSALHPIAFDRAVLVLRHDDPDA
ncbi:MAG TPA: hypothetical protein VFJ20_09910 [Gemmatimonadaceae bacterium]|nr:hypothetical protein [Gemmatimonadaceae bacterium]